MKKNIIIPSILILLFFSIYMNYKQYALNKHYKNLIPYLLVGEEIENVDLIDKDAQLIDPMQLKKGVSVVFVFLKECSPCDKNIVFWRKFAKLFDKKISVTSVVLNTPTEGFKFAEKAKLNFNVYVPDDLPKYVRDMKMSINQSQTIILKDGRVEMVRVGILDSETAIEIMSKIKGLLK